MEVALPHKLDSFITHCFVANNSERPVDALAVKKMNDWLTHSLKSRDASASKNAAIVQWWSPESHPLFPFVRYGPFLGRKISILHIWPTHWAYFSPLGIFLPIGHIFSTLGIFLHISIVYWLIGRGQDSCDSSTGISLSCRPNWLPALHCFKLYHYHYNKTSNFPS